MYLFSSWLHFRLVNKNDADLSTFLNFVLTLKLSSRLNILTWLLTAVLGLRQPLATKRPLKMMKNVFLFHLDFWLCILVMQKNGLTLLISKFLTLQPGKQTVTMHVMLNMSKSKGNQRIKFGEVIECNMRNVFLKKSYTKYGEGTIHRSFLKK